MSASVFRELSTVSRRCRFQTHLCDLAAPFARGLLKNIPPPEIRGRRECRARNAPAASHAMKKSIRVSHHGHTETTRHSPRNGFTAYFALSSVTTLFDTVACASSHRLDAK